MEAQSLPCILNGIRAISSLNPQERHAVLQELVSVCGYQDLQGLRRLLKVPTDPGYDALSILPQELVHRIFRFVDAWDLIQLLAVCTSWRRILLRNASLWKDKLLEFVPSESMVVMETLASDYCQADGGPARTTSEHTALYPSTSSTGWLKTRRMLSKRSIGEGLDACTSERLRWIARMTFRTQKTDKPSSHDEDMDCTRKERRIREDQEEQERQTMQWRGLLTRELSIQYNWEHGHCLGDMGIVSHKDFKPVVLAWPYLFVGQGHVGVRVIQLNKLKQHFGRLARGRQSSLADQTYHRGIHGGGNYQGQPSSNTIDIRTILDSVLFEVPHFLTTLACNQHEDAGHDGAPTWGYGLMNSGIGWSDFQGKCIEPLFNLHYNAIAHVAFLKNRFLSINLTGRLLLTSTDPESRRTIFAQAQISRDGKILQVETADFARCERLYKGEMVEWEEAIFLGHEDGITLLDEEARLICEISDLDNVRKHRRGGKLIQFQVIHDAQRQEILVLYETSTRSRRRRVVSIEFEDGFSREVSRKELLGDPYPLPNIGQHTNEEHNSSTADGSTTSPPISPSSSSARSSPSPPLSSAAAMTGTTRLTSDPFGYQLPLGRGGDARDSIVMYRDRVGIVSHRYCSFDLGHYCVLQVINVRTDLNSDDDLDGKNDPFAALQSEPIVIQGGQQACRILAMDHARIVLGIGASTLRVIWL
ncbi:hypothetical protein BGZ73_004439 [Actinomortierella ambigua]|nr:hypothetical protein BGZ73_004439 [Actinomortierella ambigua]